MIIKKKIKVLVIDDSAVMRNLLTSIMHEEDDIQVVGAAANPLVAREMIKTLKPDVLTLDIEMPGMDGITFLEKLMRLHPLPVVMVSSHTEKGAQSTLRALALGAVDFVTKPQNSMDGIGNELMEEIRDKVRAAASAHVRPSVDGLTPEYRHHKHSPVSPFCREGIIAIGASAGGTQAISEILEKLPRPTPGIAIVQHMPPKFTASFAERLNNLCDLDVREAKNGDLLKPGVALIAPGGLHMAIISVNRGYAVRVYSDEPVNRHRPSVDVLFDSVARIVGENALGIILTSMGSDGARGLYTMKTAGAHTIAQDEKTCVVFGMPDQAIRHNAVCEILPLELVSDRIVEWGNTNQRTDGKYRNDDYP